MGLHIPAQDHEDEIIAYVLQTHMVFRRDLTVAIKGN